MSEDIIRRNDGSILTPIKNSLIPDVFDLPQHIPPNLYCNEFDDLNIATFEERTKPFTDRMDKIQKELVSQTSELEKVRYENMKLNAQVEVLNKNNDRQLSEIERLQEINGQLKITNKKLEDDAKHRLKKDILIGLIPSAIILIVTIILTHYGLL